MKNIKASQAKAPGKIIVSGEHAVVHGQPAIAMAINQYIHVSVSASTHIAIHFIDQHFIYELNALKAHCTNIEKRFQQYQQNQKTIKEVLQHPGELLLLILQDYPLQQGLRLDIHSELAIGCGMGASAALITASIIALNHYFNQPQDINAVYDKALAIEHYQHGQSSGLDIAVALQGGAIFAEQKQRRAFSMQANDLFIINSGVPQSSTGECVEHVKKFSSEHKLWQEFSSTCHHIKNALSTNNIQTLQQGIRENHRLLCYIGVVPAAIQDFIQKIENLGFAAKISGAGSICGDQAGMLLIAAQDNCQTLQKLSDQYGYTCNAIQGEPHGAGIN